MKHFYTNLGENWFSYSLLYENMVKRFPSNSHFVEVGTWKGMSACFMAVEIINSNKRIKFDCVDTWEYVPTSIDICESLYDDLYDVFVKNIEPVKNNINIIRSISWDGAKEYKDNSLDFVFIDAGHDYESVKKDISSWFPKMKSSGIIAGHDYYNDGTCKVRKAVDEFFEGRNEKVEQFPGGCWTYNLK